MTPTVQTATAPIPICPSAPIGPPSTPQLGRALAGDAEAFGQLLDRLERPCLAVAYAVTQDAHLAADAVQEAALKAWQARRSVRDPERFESWLLSIVRRAGVDVLRRRPAKLRLTGDAPPPSAFAPGVDHVVERRETQDRVRQVLAELDEPTRLVVALRFYDGRSSREIAQVLDTTPAAVDMRLKRARERLGQLLGDLE